MNARWITDPLTPENHSNAQFIVYGLDDEAGAAESFTYNIVNNVDAREERSIRGESSSRSAVTVDLSTLGFGEITLTVRAAGQPPCVCTVKKALGSFAVEKARALDAQPREAGVVRLSWTGQWSGKAQWEKAVREWAKTAGQSPSAVQTREAKQALSQLHCELHKANQALLTAPRSEQRDKSSALQCRVTELEEQAKDLRESAKVSSEELARHCTPQDGWVLLEGTVYDVTLFMAHHPGGQMTLQRELGRDVTSKFQSIHPSVSASEILGRFIVAQGTKAQCGKGWGWLQPLRDAVGSGMSPHTLAMSIAIGMVGGVWPVWGTQFVACMSLGFILGGNVVLYMAINQFMSGVALALIPCFIWVGEAVLQVDEPFDATSLVSMLQADLLGTLQTAQFALLRGVVGWAVCTPFLIGVVYSLTRPIMAMVTRRMGIVT